MDLELCPIHPRYDNIWDHVLICDRIGSPENLHIVDEFRKGEFLKV